VARHRSKHLSLYRSAGAQPHPSARDRPDRTRVKAVFDGENSGRQITCRISFEDWNWPLSDDRAMVVLLVHEMHAHPGYPRARNEYRFVQSNAVHPAPTKCR
jgi:hypothetical protein